MAREVSQGLAAAYRSIAATRVQQTILNIPWAQTPVSTGAQEGGRRQPRAHEERLEQLGRARNRRSAVLRQAAIRRSVAFFSARRPSKVDINFLDANYDAQRARTKLKPLALPRRKWRVAAGLHRPKRRLLPTNAQRRLAHRLPAALRPKRKYTFLRKSKRLRFLERLRASPFHIPKRSEFKSLSIQVLLRPELELGQGPPRPNQVENTIANLSSEFGRYNKRAFYSIREIWKFAQAYDKTLKAGQGPEFPIFLPLPDQNRQIYLLKELRRTLTLMEYRTFIIRVKKLITDLIMLFINDGHHKCVSELHPIRRAVGLPALITRPNTPTPRAVFTTLRQLTRIAKSHLATVERSSRRLYHNGRNKVQGLEHAVSWTLKLYRLSIELRMAEIALERKYWAADYPELETAMQELLDGDMADRPWTEQQDKEEEEDEEEEVEACLYEAEVKNAGMPRYAPVAQTANMLMDIFPSTLSNKSDKSAGFPHSTLWWN